MTEKAEGKHFAKIHPGILAASIGFVIVLILSVLLIIMSLSSNEGIVSNGKMALKYLTTVSGKSAILSLPDLPEAVGEDSPETWLIENSEYELDEEAISVYVEECMEAVKREAELEGKTQEELIISWGYEDLELYKETLTETVYDFIKGRLAVFSIARQQEIVLTEEEYQEKLKVYASKYGYSDPEIFEEKCGDPEIFEEKCGAHSIANEMLFDKTIGILQNF